MSDLFKFLKEHKVELTLDRTNSTELELLAYDKIQSLEAENAELKRVNQLKNKVILDLEELPVALHNVELEKENAELRSKLERHDEIHANAVASMLQNLACANKKLAVAVEALGKVMKTRSCTSHKVGDCPTRNEREIYIPVTKALATIGAKDARHFNVRTIRLP
jgi:hypothetical protein